MATTRRKSLQPDDIENKDTFYRYHECLFSDEEFVSEARAIKDEFQQKYPSAGFDPDFLREAGASDIEIQRLYDLANKWKTSFFMLRKYLEHREGDELLLNPTLSGTRAERGLIILEMSPSVTNSQFIKMWPAVEAWKKQLTGKTSRRNRGPDDFPLLYYVNKAVLRGDSFKKISESISGDQLKGYKPSDDTKKFIYTPKEIEQFYNRYSHLLS